MSVKKTLINHQLSVKLTPAEVELKARKCATATSDLDSLDEAWKVKKKAYYDKRKPLAKKAIALAKEHMNKVELRTVNEALQVTDLDNGEIWVEYLGEIYDRREMTAYEKACATQRELPMREIAVPPTDAEPTDDDEDDEDSLLGVIHMERTAKLKIDHTA